MSSDHSDDPNDPLSRALGPPMGAWSLLRLASAILVLASLAGVVTRYLPPALGRSGDAARADVTLVFFALHAVIWAVVLAYATHRVRRASRKD